MFILKLAFVALGIMFTALAANPSGARAFAAPAAASSPIAPAN